MGPRMGSISAKTPLGVAHIMSSLLCPKEGVEMLFAIRNWRPNWRGLSHWEGADSGAQVDACLENQGQLQAK